MYKKNSSLLTLLKHSLILIPAIVILGSTSCIKKPKEINNEFQYGTIDVNNKTYTTVKIGSQWWMCENLITPAYNDGSMIPAISGAEENSWATQKQGAVDGNNNTNYNWYAINKLAPAGWHVPTDEDWKILEQHLGMDISTSNALGWRGNNEGDKLKANNNGNWPKYDENAVWGTNESGFEANTVICRMFSGNTGDPGAAFFWTSTEGPNDTTAYYRMLDYKKSNIFRQYGSKNYGFSIRLVLNQ